MPEKNTYQPYAIVLRLSFPKVSSLYASLMPHLSMLKHHPDRFRAATLKSNV